jgi:hypothetical protein
LPDGVSQSTLDARARSLIGAPSRVDGESLPITGIGFAGLGLAGAVALSWGAAARRIAARRGGGRA